MKKLILIGLLISLVLISGCSKKIEILGIPCLKEGIRTEDYTPWCETLKECITDCKSFYNGNPVDAKTMIGFGTDDVCYCEIEGEIKNIW